MYNIISGKISQVNEVKHCIIIKKTDHYIKSQIYTQLCAIAPAHPNTTHIIYLCLIIEK
jgi:hypothetical protein